MFTNAFKKVADGAQQLDFEKFKRALITIFAAEERRLRDEIQPMPSEFGGSRLAIMPPVISSRKDGTSEAYQNEGGQSYKAPKSQKSWLQGIHNIRQKQTDKALIIEE